MKVKVKKTETKLDEILAREQASPFDDAFEVGVPIREMTYGDVSRLRDWGFPDSVINRGREAAEALGDDAPQFVVVRTEEGVSRTGRLYDGTVLESIAEQVNTMQPVAHLGHIPDHELQTAFPKPQTKWIGAITKFEPSKLASNSGKNVKVIYTAGYNLPDAEVRNYITAGLVDSTSWQGRATQTPIPGRGVRVSKFDLHSIDWSRKGSEGMETAKVVAIAREMKEGHTHMDGDGKSLAEVTPEEFEKENPNGYALLVNKISAGHSDVVREMQEKLDASEADKTLLAKVRETLKVAADADPLEKLVKLMTTLSERARELVSSEVEKLLTDRIADEGDRKTAIRLLSQPVMEMQDKAVDMKDDDAVKAMVREMLDSTITNDEIVREMISESTPAQPRSRDARDASGGAKPKTSKTYARSI